MALGACRPWLVAPCSPAVTIPIIKLRRLSCTGHTATVANWTADMAGYPQGRLPSHSRQLRQGGDIRLIADRIRLFTSSNTILGTTCLQCRKELNFAAYWAYRILLYPISSLSRFRSAAA